MGKKYYNRPRPNSPASKAIRKLRGGFTVPNQLRQSIGRYTADQARSYGGKAIGYFQKQVEPRVGSQASLWMAKKATEILDKGAKQVEKIVMVHPEDNSITDTKGEPRIDVATSVKRTKVDYQGPVKSRTFVEDYVMGEKTSKSLYQAAKQNGTKTVCLFDTMNDSDYKDPTKNHREYLELVTGFNQKLIYAHQRLTPRWTDIYSEIYKIGISSTNAPNPDRQIRTMDYRIYGAALSMTNRLRFRNNVSTTSCKIKVHILGAKTLAGAASLDYRNPVSCAGVSPSATTDTNKGMDSNKIIQSTVTYPRPNAGNALGTTWLNSVVDSSATYALITPSAQVTDSELFNTRFKIVKTFAKTLDVGDELLLNLTSTFGSGLRLDKALSLTEELAGVPSDNAPKWTFPYFVMVELMGPSVTAETTDITHGEDKFIGTAPCSVSFESKQYFKYVLASTSGVPVDAINSLTESDFSSRIGQPLVRYFVKDEVVSNTPFNVRYFDCCVSATPSISIKVATTSNVVSVKTTT